MSLTILLVSGCSDAPEEPPVEAPPPAEQPAAEPAPAASPPDEEAGETPAVAPEPDDNASGGEVRWKIAVFAGLNGEFGGLGEGSLTEDANGTPVAMGIEYFFDDVRSRLVMRDGRMYLGTDDGNMRWLDVTDQVGQLSQVSTQLLREEDDDYVQLREETHGGEQFTVFAKMGEVVALDDTTAIGSRLLYWQDESGDIRRHVSIVSMRSGPDSVALISVADRDDAAQMPDWYGSAATAARFNAVRAAPALRQNLTMGRPQAYFPEQRDPTIFEYALTLAIPEAHAQSLLSSVLQDLLEQVEGDLEDAIIEDFINNLPPPGSNLSDYLTQVGLSGYDAIKNYFTPEQMQVLARSAIENTLKKIVERSLLRLAPYLGYYGLAAMFAGLIVDDIIDYLKSNVHGEPHINTFDGAGYSFQAIGEFVYFSTPGFEVQQRFSGSKGRATWAYATAVRVGENVVESYFSGPGRGTPEMTIVVNGDDVPLTGEGITFEDGSFVGRLRSQRGYRNLIVVEPGGSYVIVENLNVSQNVLFGITEPVQSLIAGGLGGVPDGNRRNDFTLRDGTVLEPQAMNEIDVMYGQFAASWRVRPEERLFTRGSAEEFLTAEYTDPPATVARLSDYSQDEQERARQICQEAGVLGETALSDCTYDVLVTGDPAWAQASGTSQVVLAMARPTDLAPAPAAVAGPAVVEVPPVSVTLSAQTPGSPVQGELQWIIIHQQTEETIIPDAGGTTVSAMLRPGLHDVIISGDNYDAESVIEVLPSGENRFAITLEPRQEERLFDAPATAAAGEVIQFSWRGPGLEDDLIFIAPPDMDENQYRRSNRHEASDPSDASLVTPAVPGRYEIRYFSFANGSVLGRQPIEITEPRVEIDAPRIVTAGAEFEFSWTGPGLEEDFLFVASPDMEVNRFFRQGRHMVADGPTGRFVAPAEPGTYEIRYYSAANGAMLSRRALVVR